MPDPTALLAAIGHPQAADGVEDRRDRTFQKFPPADATDSRAKGGLGTPSWCVVQAAPGPAGPASAGHET